MMRMKKRKNNSKKRIGGLIFFTLFLVTLVFGAVNGGRLLYLKYENNKLQSEVAKIKQDNTKTSENNKKILSDIKSAQDEYKKKTKDLKIAYLTFDDGPSNHTEEILKILKDNDVKATFFVNGRPKLREKYKKIADDGHAIGNHTFSHDYKNIYASPENFKRDVLKLNSFIKDASGKEPNHLLRYPGGSNNTVSHNYGGKNIMDSIIPVINNEGFKYFDWNVDSSDASAYCQAKNKIVQSVLSQSKSKHRAIILMHDTDPKVTTVQALPEVINGLKEEGFSFDILSEDTPIENFKTVKN